MAEEIRGVTWDLTGAHLAPWQAVQRLYLAGFEDAKLLATAYAVMQNESGCYLKAWHHNVARNADGSIKRDLQDRMTVTSTDLGFVQRNISHSPAKLILIDTTASQALVDDLFEQHPELAHGDESAAIAFGLYSARGWQPWYAHTNGNYKRSLPEACVAVANFLDKVLCGASGHAIKR